MEQQETVLQAFEALKTNKYLLEIFGSILKVGNCLNAGNKTRGQADGFEIEAISKTFSIKDTNGSCIMLTICQKMFEKDEEFTKFKDSFPMCYKALKCKVDEIKTESDKAKGALNTNTSQFELIKKVDPEAEELIFGKQIKVFLQESEKMVEKLQEKNKVVADKYLEICDYFMLNSQDEMRKKSDKFFTFWTQFIDDVQKQIPKPQKAPAKKKVGGNDTKKAV